MPKCIGTVDEVINPRCYQGGENVNGNYLKIVQLRNIHYFVSPLFFKEKGSNIIFPGTLFFLLEERKDFLLNYFQVRIQRNKSLLSVKNKTLLHLAWITLFSEEFSLSKLSPIKCLQVEQFFFILLF
jgi:hypothetical protein